VEEKDKEYIRYLLEHLEAKIDQVDKKVDALGTKLDANEKTSIQRHKDLSDHFVRIAERNRKRYNDHEKRLRQLEKREPPDENTESALDRPLTPVHAWQPRPPAKSFTDESDSEIHDLEALKRMANHDKRNDSWMYKRTGKLALLALKFVAAAAAGGCLHYLWTHIF